MASVYIDNSHFPFFEKRTINAMVEFFQTSKGMDLERLTSATLTKLEEIKERTAAGKITNLR